MDFYWTMKSKQIISEVATTLQVFVKPNAKKTQIVNLSSNEITIKLKAIAQDGKANLELKDFLSSICGVKKSEITILRGEKSKEKYIKIQNKTQKEIEENLKKEFEENSKEN